jgi:uronate dehydrogenase
MRVLVTGAAGSIGRVVAPGLVELGHDVVGLDLVEAPDGGAAAWHVVDCADPDRVAQLFAAEPVDAVVHLAGIPGEASLPESLTSHVVTTAALLEAMVGNGVRRIVYASSNHAVGMTPRSERVGVDVRPRPDTFYGVGKVAAEALLSLYADRHGLDTVSCRVGSFLERPETRRGLSTWLSHGDGVRMVQAALTCPAPGFAVLYGISANTRAWWDLQPGRDLGYEPQDDAEAWADVVESRPADDAEAARVGGPFAGLEAARPAF